MPTLLDNLSNEKQTIARQIINKLRATMSKSLESSALIDQFRQKIAESDSFVNLHSVVREAMLEGREPYQVYLHATEGMDEDIFNAIEEYIKNDGELTKIKNALHFSASLEMDILSAKERLSLQILHSKLSEKDKQTADNFIARLKELQAISSTLFFDREKFKERLKNVSSDDEVAEIEIEVEDYNQSLLVAYDTLCPFPDNEIVAEALIEFLETNVHLSKIMEPINFYESLMDDILASRSSVCRYSP